MEEVIFTCLSPGGTCEWFHLKDFVDAFNMIHNTSYIRSECLDVYGKGNEQPAQTPKRPEVLLECEGQVPMVIERKAVVWPSMFQRDHSKEHNFPRDVADFVREQFSDRLYEFSFCADDLKGESQRQVRGFAKEISNLIILNCAQAKSPGGIRSRSPVPWGFRPLGSNEVDDAHQARGVRSCCKASSQCDLSPLECSQDRKLALEGFADRFNREASKAAQKFDDFTDCLKLLVVQFFGDSDHATDEDIVGIITASQLPKQIDQVWLTGREWVSLDDHELVWERVR